MSKPDLSQGIKDALVSIFSVTVKADRVETFLSALDEVMPHSAAEEGIIRFEVFRNRDNAQNFTIIDLYRDREAFDEHSKTPHIARFGGAISDCFEGTSSMGLFELHDGIPSKA